MRNIHVLGAGLTAALLTLSTAAAAGGPPANAPSHGGFAPVQLPDDYPWEPRETPPSAGGDDGGEPWIGGIDWLVDPSDVEVSYDGEPTYSITGVEIYEEGPDQSRVVVSYTGGDGIAGLAMSIGRGIDLPPDIPLPGDGFDTGMVNVPGATAELGGDLEVGDLVEPAGDSRITGVSIGEPSDDGTPLFIGLDQPDPQTPGQEEGYVLWAVVDHPGTLVFIATDFGTNASDPGDDPQPEEPGTTDPGGDDDADAVLPDTR